MLTFLGLAPDVPRVFIVSKPYKARVPQVCVRRPLSKLDLCHYQGP